MSFFMARIGAAGRERPVVIVDGIAASIETLTTDIDRDFIEGGGVDRVHPRAG